MWMARQRLGGGQNWTIDAERSIAQRAALVLIATRAALASPMVRRESPSSARETRNGEPLSLLLTTFAMSGDTAAA